MFKNALYILPKLVLYTLVLVNTDMLLHICEEVNLYINDHTNIFTLILTGTLH